MNILIDTNIVIPLEDTGRPLRQEFADLRRIADEQGYRLYIHPAQIQDVLRDRDEARRELILSRIQLYSQIPNPPQVTTRDVERYGWTELSDNDRVDNLLLQAVARDAAHILISDDRRLWRKAKRAGIQERVYRLDQALYMLYRQLLPSDYQPPFGIRERYLHEFDVEDMFFDSLREGYPDFNSWYRAKALGHRRCWAIADETGRDLHAICVYKSEESPIVTDDGHTIRGSVLKICTFKVGETIRGNKIGERLLYTAFRFAVDRGFDWVYLHADSERHVQFVELCIDYGFQHVGTYRKDDVYAKPMHPALMPPPSKPLEFAIQFYPHFRTDTSVRSYLVPIQPAYHEELFPDISDLSNGLFGNEPWLMRPQSNTIKKAYVCNTNVGSIEPGDLLFFYRSQDRQSVEVIGVVETAVRTSDLSLAMSLVAKRTVYNHAQLSDQIVSSDSGVLVILFRLMQYIRPVGKSEIEAAGVKGPFQTIRYVPTDVFVVSQGPK